MIMFMGVFPQIYQFTIQMVTDSKEHCLDSENTVTKKKERLKSTVVLVPGETDVCLLAAQYVIVHCLMLASWEAVTKVCSSTQARPLTWCNR